MKDHSMTKPNVTASLVHGLAQVRVMDNPDAGSAFPFVVEFRHAGARKWRRVDAYCRQADAMRQAARTFFSLACAEHL